MDFIFKHKMISLAAVIAVAAVLWYFLSGSSSSSSSNSVLTTTEVSAVPPDAQELLSTLETLRGVQLDDSIFHNPSFQALKDFTNPVIPEPVGRPIPFAPIGIDIGSYPSATPAGR